MSTRQAKKTPDFIPPEINWDELEDPVQAIKRRTRMYKDKSIIEAFNLEYGLSLQKKETYDIEEMTNLHPIVKGEVFTATIESIGKDHAVLSRNNSKECLKLKQSLYGWNVKVGDELEVEATDVVKGEVTVDAVKPMVDSWVKTVKSTLFNRFQSSEVTVEDLHLLPGGYTGKINIAEVTGRTGKPHYIKAFVPGSHICLNIEQDFSRWEGQSVRAMVMNFTERNGELGVIASRKKYLNSIGGQSLVNIFDAGYGQGTPFDQVTFDGKVTGIINSSKKCGVFVEVEDYSITGLLEKSAEELVNYRIGDPVKVQIEKLDWDQAKEPYVRNRDGIITEVNLKPVFKEVK